MKRALLFSILLTCLAGPVLAEVTYYNAALTAEKEKETISTPVAADLPGALETSNFSSVTTLDSCLKNLPEKDQIEVRSHYSKPYQECRRRISDIKTIARETITAENPPPNLPAGWKFFQVWKKNDKKETP